VIEFEKANVRWFLSINEDTLPEIARSRGERTFRSIRVDEKEIGFSEGFTDLHTASYKAVLEGKGFSLHDAAPSIRLAYEIRNAKLSPFQGNYHPLVNLPHELHPFLKEH
jgi:UDP-N-acetyl-2-amino-2-deoxyglucuronate dehydrogenase